MILATFLLLGESISVKTEQNCTDSITCTWILITVLNTDCEKILVYIIFKECSYNAYSEQFFTVIVKLMFSNYACF